MKIEYPHSFPIEEAVARMRALTDYWDQKYGIASEWQENCARIKGKVKGIVFDGTFEIEANRLLAEVQVGFLAEKLGARSYVEQKLAHYLDPKNTLEGLRAG